MDTYEKPPHWSVKNFSHIWEGFTSFGISNFHQLFSYDHILFFIIQEMMEIHLIVTRKSWSFMHLNVTTLTKIQILLKLWFIAPQQWPTVCKLAFGWKKAKSFLFFLLNHMGVAACRGSTEIFYGASLLSHTHSSRRCECLKWGQLHLGVAAALGHRLLLCVFFFL